VITACPDRYERESVDRRQQIQLKLFEAIFYEIVFPSTE